MNKMLGEDVQEPDRTAIAHLVFDCDGVLWEGTNEGYFRCYHSAAVDAGISLEFDVAKERILKNWGHSARQEVEGMIPDHPELVAEVLRNYRRLMQTERFSAAASLVPGADRALEQLNRSYRMSAMTGMDADNLGRLLARFGLRGYFRHTVTTSDTNDPEKQKPTGYHLRRMMHAEQLRPEQVLCVGDAVADVQMAHSQGVAIVVVLTGHLSERQAKDLGATAVLPSVAALPEWLGRARSR